MGLSPGRMVRALDFITWDWSGNGKNISFSWIEGTNPSLNTIILLSFYFLLSQIFKAINDLVIDVYIFVYTGLQLGVINL